MSKILLFNHTKHDDKIIQKVLAYAARRLKVPGRTAVRVNSSRIYFPGATAFRGWACEGYLKTWRNSDSMKRIGAYGFIEMRIPVQVRSIDEAEKAAEWFVSVATHEMAHIKDYRKGQFVRSDRLKHGRRPKHRQRPIEISAENHAYDARPKTPKEKEARAQLVASVASMLEQTIERKTS